jgi:hypothetical protein
MPVRHPGCRRTGRTIQSSPGVTGPLFKAMDNTEYGKVLRYSRSYVTGASQTKQKRVMPSSVSQQIVSYPVPVSIHSFILRSASRVGFIHDWPLTYTWQRTVVVD